MDQADAALTRSEERLLVGTRWHGRRVRISKRIVTETVVRTFELSHEELFVEELDDDGSAVNGPSAAFTPLEVVLHREELVATKQVVPYERARIHKDLITEDHRIVESLRREEIDADQELLP